MSNPAISAVICTYDRYRTLAPAVESLTRQTLAPDAFEIIVVDNSPDHRKSAKNSEEYAHIPNLAWLIEKIPGLSNARNVATRRAKSEIVAFMDDDAVAEPAWLEQILTAFDEFGDRAGAVGGCVKLIWDEPRPDWLHEDFLSYLSAVDWGGEARVIGGREWLAGTNIAFRVADLVDAGGFSTTLGRKGNGYALLSNEEVEVCERLKELGKASVYAPDAVMGHRAEGNRLTQGWFRRRVAWQAVSDCLRDAAVFEKAPAYWKQVTKFVNSLPPRERSLRALYTPIADADTFRQQLSAIYNFTIATMAGFTGIEP